MTARPMTLTPLVIGLLLAFATPAQAQDHSQHQMPTPMPAPAQEHAQEAVKPQSQPTAKAKAAIDHSEMGHDVPSAQPQEGEPIDHSAMGHARSSSERTSTPLPALTDADRAAAFPAVTGHAMHDNQSVSFVQFNRLEAWNADSGTGLSWEGQAWIGNDLDKLRLRSEGAREGGRTEAADLEVLYGRAVARWWDLVAGLRHDFRPGPSQGWIAIGVVGLAPQKFEVEATAYFGESGQTAARIEAEYELLLTNRLVLQPLVEVNLYGKNDAGRGVGSGLGTVESGLRLRYEFTRKFAPYIGVVHEHAYGNTAEIRRAEGEDGGDTRLVAGIRIWF